MPKSTAPEATPGLVHVWPHPDLPPTDYLPGIGAAGAALPTEEAAPRSARGLATTSPPAAPADKE